jgi:hypothetical protein
VGGDVGKYILGLLDLRDDYKKAVIDLFDCFDEMLSKNRMTDEALAEATQKKLVRTLAWLEMKLPILWSTAVRHILLHINPKMEVWGVFWAHNMLHAESNHKYIKKSTRSSKSPMASIRNNLFLLDNAFKEKETKKTFVSGCTPTDLLKYDDRGRLVVKWKTPKQPKVLH